MVSSILNRKAIELRAANLASLESSARTSIRFAGEASWILGDAIKATLADVRSLLDAQSDDVGAAMLRANIGLMRAHGYTIHEPGAAPKSDTTPAPPADSEDTIASGTGPFMCLNCEAVLAPGETCTRYLDCQKLALPEEGSFIRIVGGIHDGRHARVDVKKPGSIALCAVLLGKATVPVGAVDVSHERVVVVGHDPDAPTTVEPAAERTRNEPPCLAKDWAPTPAQIKGYAKDLGITEARTVELIAEFRARPDLAAPQARWGGAFKAWVDRLPAV